MNPLPISMGSVFSWLAAASAESTDGVMVLKGTGNILFCNDVILRIFDLRASPQGCSFSEVFGRDGSWLGDQYSESFYEAVTGNGKSLFTAITLRRPEGEEVYSLLRLSAPADEEKLTFCLLTKAVTSSAVSSEPLGEEEEKENEGSLHAQLLSLVQANAQLRIINAERNAVAQTLRRMESRYRDIFDNAIEGIFQWTPDWRLLSANRAFAKMMGYSTVNDLMRSAEDISFHFCLCTETGDELAAELEQKNHIIDYEFQVARRDGSPLWASINARRVVGPGGRTKYYEGFIENISGRKMTEEKLIYQAFHDPLTGLANRALFQDRLRMAMHRAARQPEYRFAVLTLDLDRFKMVNDSLGHSTGDDVLCHAAVSLLSCVREVDTVARLGGDEFAILLEETDGNTLAVRVAKRIHTTLNQPFLVSGREISIGASIGIVLKGEKYESPEDMLRDADTAMYQAKADRGVCYKIFTRKMRAESQDSIVFETELRQGLTGQEFWIGYQPIVQMQSGRLSGFEALLRWNHNGKAVSPASFIPMAEDTGLIRKLGLFAIESVCRQVNEWKRRHDFSFATHLNISARQLMFPGFPRDVQRVLERTNVDPSLLVFEITESALLDRGGTCLQAIHHIRDLGIRFCLDDFGTGFSSLSYLRQLPLSCMKVDRSFITDVETDRQSMIIVRNLVGLGNELGLSVVVEGVERQSQASVLLDAGCSLAQGYHFSHPLPSRKAEELLRTA